MRTRVEFTISFIFYCKLPPALVDFYALLLNLMCLESFVSQEL